MVLQTYLPIDYTHIEPSVPVRDKTDRGNSIKSQILGLRDPSSEYSRLYLKQQDVMVLQLVKCAYKVCMGSSGGEFYGLLYPANPDGRDASCGKRIALIIGSALPGARDRRQTPRSFQYTIQATRVLDLSFAVF